MFRHDWDITPSEAVRLQRRLSGEVREEPLAGPVRTIAGTDCAFAGGGGRIVATVVLCDAGTMEVLATADADLPCRFPYVPGLLSFREAPAVIAAVEKLPEPPDLLLCDGQGVAHPRGLGLASHVGIWLDLPAIGVAKSRLCGDYREPGLRRRCRTRLKLDGRVVGAVVRTRANVKPLFVSVGHLVTLEDSIRWTLRCARRFRLPEPNRLAHHRVGRLRRE